MNASARTSPSRSATAKARSTSSGRRDIGFSHSTCLPASRARIDHSTCIELGSGTYTASTSGSSSSAS
jgi:hypothetical protein